MDNMKIFAKNQYKRTEIKKKRSLKNNPTKLSTFRKNKKQLIEK